MSTHFLRRFFDQILNNLFSSPLAGGRKQGEHYTLFFQCKPANEGRPVTDSILIPALTQKAQPRCFSAIQVTPSLFSAFGRKTVRHPF
jgi:hypothetical protein